MPHRRGVDQPGDDGHPLGTVRAPVPMVRPSTVARRPIVGRAGTAWPVPAEGEGVEAMVVSFFVGARGNTRISIAFLISSGFFHNKVPNC